MVRLDDIARVYRGYVDPPGNLARVDGDPALMLSVISVISPSAVRILTGIWTGSRVSSRRSLALCAEYSFVVVSMTLPRLSGEALSHGVDRHGAPRA